MGRVAAFVASLSDAQRLRLTELLAPGKEK
jgi:hypothetical protein